MSAIEISAKVQTLLEWQDLAAQAAEMVETLQDEIKAEMLSRDTEEMTAGKFIIRWTTTISNRLDTGALKKAYPDICQAFTKAQTSRRFKISQ